MTHSSKEPKTPTGPTAAEILRAIFRMQSIAAIIGITAAAVLLSVLAAG